MKSTIASDQEQLLQELFHALSQALTTLGCCLNNALQEPHTADLRTALQQVEAVNLLFGRIRTLVEASYADSRGRPTSLGNLPCHSPLPLPVADNSGQ